MNIGPEILTIQQRKDPHNQAIANALNKLGQLVSNIGTAPANAGIVSGLAIDSEFRYAPIAYTPSFTPIYPDNVLLYANRISLTGNIIVAAPYNIQTGKLYTIILESDGSTRTATFSTWYGFLTGTPISIPPNSRLILTCISIDTATSGRQISNLLQSTGGGGGTTWTGPTLVAPTAAASWTLVNGLSLSDGVQSTLIASKNTSTLGLALKALPAGAFDLIVGVQNVNFGNLLNSLSALPTFIVAITNGTNAGVSSGFGIATYKFNSSPNTGILTRQYSPLNSAAPTALTAYNIVGVGLNTGSTSWFRISGTTGTSFTLYAGDGLTWDFITTLGFACTHFGFGLDPTGGVGAASQQIVRIVSCSL